MEEEKSLDLSQLWNLIKKRLKLIIAVTILCVAATGYISYKVLPRVYESNYSIIIGKVTNTSNSPIAYNDVMMYQNLAKTYAQIGKSKVVMTETSSNLSSMFSADIIGGLITITPQQNTQIIDVKVRNRDPKTAQNIALAHSQAFLKESMEYIPGNIINIMDPASFPVNPVKPRPVLNMAIAFVLSILVSVGVIFLIENMDRTMKNEWDVKNDLDMPVIGVIPFAK